MNEAIQVKGLILDMYKIPQKHPLQLMKNLGITYALAVPQSMGDCWQFYLPENVPKRLPKYLKLVEFAPMEQIGYGLSEENALNLISKHQTLIKGKI